MLVVPPLWNLDQFRRWLRVLAMEHGVQYVSMFRKGLCRRLTFEPGMLAALASPTWCRAEANRTLCRATHSLKCSIRWTVLPSNFRETSSSDSTHFQTLKPMWWSMFMTFQFWGSPWNILKAYEELGGNCNVQNPCQGLCKGASMHLQTAQAGIDWCRPWCHNMWRLDWKLQREPRRRRKKAGNARVLWKHWKRKF